MIAPGPRQDPVARQAGRMTLIDVRREEPVVKREATVKTTSTDLGPLSFEMRIAEVYCWRVEQLTRAGFEDGHAHLLAEDSRIDLHQACDLVRRGCPSPTAFRILS